jgi:hypothetical protein
MADFTDDAGRLGAQTARQRRRRIEAAANIGRVVYAQSALGAYSTVHNVLADKAAVLPDAISFEQAAACSKEMASGKTAALSASTLCTVL